MSAIWKRGGVRALLVAVPAVLAAVLPAIFFVAVSLLPVENGARPPQAIVSLLGGDAGSLGYRPFWVEAFTTLICPMFYLCVPIVCGVASASGTFVSEKEDCTLETLFLSSMNARSIFNAKITSCSLISVAISWISFVVFAIIASVADVFLSAPYFFSLEWLISAVLLTPALSLFSVVFVSLALPKVRTVGESLQTMGYLILPLVALYLLQFTGLFKIGFLPLIGIAVLLVLLSVVLYNASSRRFQAEKLLYQRGA